MSNAIRETKNYGKINISRIYVGEKQKEGSKTVEVKQVVTTTSFYPSKVFNNSLEDSLFSESAYGAPENTFTNTETRVAWPIVPVGASEEDIRKMIEGLKDARIKKILSHAPILNANQQKAVDNGLRTLDEYANAQVVRYGDTHEKAGQPVLYNGKVQYKVNAFCQTAVEDEDRRPTTEEFRSKELEAELNPAFMIEDNQEV